MGLIVQYSTPFSSLFGAFLLLDDVVTEDFQSGGFFDTIGGPC
jgi:hypothetical protein